jgi:hypothetical protein
VNSPNFRVRDAQRMREEGDEDEDEESEEGNESE